eukprot:gene24073-9649_t
MPKATSKAPPKNVKRISASKDEEEQEQEPVKVSLYDGGAVKNAMDEYISEIFTKAGYDQDVSISNVRILFGFLAIVIALYAQFGMGKLPDAWWGIFLCIAAYTIITLAVNVYSSMYEGDAFLISQPSKTHPFVIRVSSMFNRKQGSYTLQLETSTEPGNKKIQKNLTCSIGEFFHSDGYLAAEALSKEISSFLSEYEVLLQSGAEKKTK